MQERWLTAIMFTDIVGYTSLMGSDAVYCTIEIQKAGKENKILVMQILQTWDDYNWQDAVRVVQKVLLEDKTMLSI